MDAACDRSAWLSLVLERLRHRIASYGDDDEIGFNLMAIVSDRQAVSEAEIRTLNALAPRISDRLYQMQQHVDCDVRSDAIQIDCLPHVDAMLQRLFKDNSLEAFESICSLKMADEFRYALDRVIARRNKRLAIISEENEQRKRIQVALLVSLRV